MSCSAEMTFSHVLWGFFSLFFPPLLFRPSTKCGPDLGEAVPGGEAERSGGAAGDV